MTRHSSPSRLQKSALVRRGIFLALGLLCLYFLLPKLGSFHDSLTLWRQAKLGWVVVAFAAFSATYFAAAGMYRTLALKPLHYFQTVLAQLAAMFAGKLLPAGLGALGVNYEYLRRHAHTQAQAGAVAAMNNTIGFIGHGLLFVVVILVAGKDIELPHATLPKSIGYWVAGSLVMVGILAIWSTMRGRLAHFLQHLAGVFLTYRRQPATLLVALLYSVTLTILYVVSLYACTQALGVIVAPPKLFIIMTLGVAGATAAPTPGGLGGAEAGLVGGLVLYGIDGQTALAVALLYRLVTYWVPLGIGAGAFLALERRHAV